MNFFNSSLFFVVAFSGQIIGMQERTDPANSNDLSGVRALREIERLVSSKQSASELTYTSVTHLEGGLTLTSSEQISVERFFEIVGRGDARLYGDLDQRMTFTSGARPEDFGGTPVAGLLAYLHAALSGRSSVRIYSDMYLRDRVFKVDSNCGITGTLS